jgi:hypothetical protein
VEENIMSQQDQPVSGLYHDTNTGNELRLDVDWNFPQMMASGTFNNSVDSTHWIAKQTPSGPLTWEGAVIFRHPADAQLPFNAVKIAVTGNSCSGNLKASVTFSGLGTLETTVEYVYKSPYYHPVEFEFDVVEGTEEVTSIETHSHPNRPDTLPDETLTIEEVYRRAGFNVSVSTHPDNVVPLSLATDAGEPLEEQELWDDNELHDAMQTYWSRFEDRAQWAMWVIYASLHEADEPNIFNPDPQPEDLGGIMFDDIGPNHRQGTSIFTDSFIKFPPADDLAPDAWVRRMRFWTAVHEMGHAFNLAHSWQKHLGKSWILPLVSDPEARSFMNYPGAVTGGQEAFFADFEFRFIDQELNFMRHAPEAFVQMGNADWFDNHGFRRFKTFPSPPLNLELRVNRDPALFQFLEPITIELKLKNVSREPQLVDEHILSDLEEMTVIVKKDGRPARQFVPFARYCWESRKSVLMPGKAAYQSLFISAGRNGWDLAEPGYYNIQIALHLDDEDIVSNPLRLRVAPPTDYDEEFLAQDFFGDEVGRVMALDGSLFLTKGNDILREAAERFPDHRVAMHARIALGAPLARPFKQLQLDDVRESMKSACLAGGKIVVKPIDEKGGEAELKDALLTDASTAAESLGHVDFKYYAEMFSDFLAKLGNIQDAAKVLDVVHKTLSQRGVLKTVLDEVTARRESYTGGRKKKK